MTKDSILWRGRRSFDQAWFEGNLIVSNTGEASIVEKRIVEYDGHHLRIDSDEPQFFDQHTISVFTGYTVNYERLYNGDFIEYKDEVYQVVYDDYLNIFKLVYFSILDGPVKGEGDTVLLSHELLRDCKIIGILGEYPKKT